MFTVGAVTRWTAGLPSVHSPREHGCITISGCLIVTVHILEYVPRLLH